MSRLLVISGKDTSTIEAFSNTLREINTHFKEHFPGESESIQVQEDLADEFINNPTFTSRTPLIILTQSKALLKRLQSRVKEGILSKEEIEVYNVTGDVLNYKGELVDTTNVINTFFKTPKSSKRSKNSEVKEKKVKKVKKQK